MGSQCYLPLQFPKPTVNGRIGIHVLTTNRDKNTLVLLQPINKKYNHDTDVCDQWTHCVSVTTTMEQSCSSRVWLKKCLACVKHRISFTCHSIRLSASEVSHPAFTSRWQSFIAIRRGRGSKDGEGRDRPAHFLVASAAYGLIAEYADVNHRTNNKI